MKLILDGNINVYYVQTLCMIFFPGAKFGAENADEGAELHLRLTESEEGACAEVHVELHGKSAAATRTYPYDDRYDREKTAKLAA